MEGLIQLISVLLIILFVYLAFSVIGYIHQKKRHDIEIKNKLDELIERLNDLNKK